MVLAWEVVEKGALADVGGLGDVFHGGVYEALLRKKLERRAEQPLANLRAAAQPARDRLALAPRSGPAVLLWHGDPRSYMTISHNLDEGKPYVAKEQSAPVRATGAPHPALKVLAGYFREAGSDRFFGDF